MIPGDCTIASEKLLIMRKPFLVTYPINSSLKVRLLPKFCDFTSVFVRIDDLCIHIYIFAYMYVCVCVSLANCVSVKLCQVGSWKKYVYVYLYVCVGLYLERRGCARRYIYTCIYMFVCRDIHTHAHNVYT